MTTNNLPERLRDMHSDLKQGVMYTHAEDPDWDVTAAAAAEIERLSAENGWMQDHGLANAEIEKLREALAWLRNEAREQRDQIIRLREDEPGPAPNPA